jgi:Uma2 family endonuclease
LYVRGLKSRCYRSLPSLKQYLIVDHEQPLIELYQPSKRGKWELEDARKLSESILLESIGGKLSLKAVYEKVRFPAAPSGPKPGPR